MIEYKDAMWILDIKISLILSKTIHCEKWNILKRANSFVCELLTCKGDKQATLEEAGPQPDSGFLLPELGMFFYVLPTASATTTNQLFNYTYTGPKWPSVKVISKSH